MFPYSALCCSAIGCIISKCIWFEQQRRSILDSPHSDTPPTPLCSPIDAPSDDDDDADDYDGDDDYGDDNDGDDDVKYDDSVASDFTLFSY